jgi:hypothetical protein
MRAMDRMVWTALVLAAIANTVLIASAARTAAPPVFSGWHLRGTIAG